MPISPIEWAKGKVRIIDQTKLPTRLKYIECEDVCGLGEAIKTLRIRGAPALGIAAGFGVVLGAKRAKSKNFPSFKKEVDKVFKEIASTRPTARNLFWALERMKKTLEKNKKEGVERLKELLLEEALKIQEEEREVCRLLSREGAKLLTDGDRVLTHCNAGALATGGYGTALGMIYEAVKEGKRIEVYSCETRPLLQGARLTTWELKEEGIPVTLICDNMAGWVMKEGKVKKVLVGADRVARNGDTANKIGTFSLAVLAREMDIPFYVACPTSTIDLSLFSGEEIPVEKRNEEEIFKVRGKRIAPRGILAYNPAFDVTPSQYITGIITEKGVIFPPYQKNIPQIMESQK